MATDNLSTIALFIEANTIDTEEGGTLTEVPGTQANIRGEGKLPFNATSQ
jgi:hypothetical protein